MSIGDRVRLVRPWGPFAAGCLGRVDYVRSGAESAIDVILDTDPAGAPIHFRVLGAPRNYFAVVA